MSPPRKDSALEANDHAADTGHSHDHGDDHDHEHSHDDSIWGRIKSIYTPHSHDSADSIDSALESSAKGIRAVKVSLVGLMVTAVLQVLIVIVTGSVALLADTIHNFSDALTSIPLWIAFILGRRAATRSYTYGYRRAEDLSGLFIVLMIAFSAILAGWESIDRLFNPREVEQLGLVAAAGVIGFIGNEIVALYRIRVGREIKSAALVADGYHARTDGLTSLAVLFGAMGVALGFPAADPIIGLLITVAILFILRDATKQVFRRLMDGVEPATVDVVERHSATVDGVLGVDNIRVRWIGHRLDASLQVVVDESLSVLEGHDIALEVRRSLEHAMPNLDHLVVHVEPDGNGHTDFTDAHASITQEHHAP
jgi:cation diffusion facilitator family transporter